MDDAQMQRCLIFIDQHTHGEMGGADLEREARVLAIFVAAECESASLAGVKEGLEMAWRDGFNCARNCVSEDEAFCLTEDVEGDAWLDSATAIRAIPVKADDRERA